MLWLIEQDAKVANAWPLAMNYFCVVDSSWPIYTPMSAISGVLHRWQHKLLASIMSDPNHTLLATIAQWRIVQWCINIMQGFRLFTGAHI